jgi:hypothetical protein
VGAAKTVAPEVFGQGHQSVASWSYRSYRSYRAGRAGRDRRDRGRECGPEPGLGGPPLAQQVVETVDLLAPQM